MKTTVTNSVTPQIINTEEVFDQSSKSTKNNNDLFTT